ncbi:hypothetical protein SERLA73DRAFT_74211 [Serpula lacrymans var. lacrymans S7.3]|uniref:Glutathione synthetase n=1 Tax=Serpula lacrymans var. lacrymans (strain S7.3) TaxID=936435 RepID=F8Q0X9_SERL3|nr:hypothetical protein SERLA73DRAFT_74211 [Serpula lacrymans var. lacrymans S7.3]
MSTAFSFTDWPPSLSDSQIDTLTHLATTYALSHGLLYLPSDTQPQDPCSAIHAPLSLIPSPVPRASFTLAKRLQHIYNDIYARIAMDEAFLDRVMGAVEGVGKADEFVGTLWRGWKEVREEGLVQTLQLGLFRSDYLLHAPDEAAPSLKQVEFNTISSSFGPLSERAAALHRSVPSTSPACLPHLLTDTSTLPPDTTACLPTSPPTTSLQTRPQLGSHKVSQRHTTPTLYPRASLLFISSSPRDPRFRAQILFVVQQRERNVFDQRWLEYELLHAYVQSTHYRTSSTTQAQPPTVTPSTSSAKHSTSSPTPSTSTQPPAPSTSPLPPPPPPSRSPPSTLTPPSSSSPIEISTIYFRAGYTPSDFSSPTHYATRIALERTLAIKCPLPPPPARRRKEGPGGVDPSRPLGPSFARTGVLRA